jgi:hypothetical protein
MKAGFDDTPTLRRFSGHLPSLDARTLYKRLGATILVGPRREPGNPRGASWGT